MWKFSMWTHGILMAILREGVWVCIMLQKSEFGELTEEIQFPHILCLYYIRIEQALYVMGKKVGVGRIGVDVGMQQQFFETMQMKKRTKEVESPQQSSKKLTNNQQITSKLLSGILETLTKQLNTGKMAISPIRKIIPAAQHTLSHPSSNPEEQLEKIEESLKSLRASMQNQRRAEREQEKTLKKKAQELIDRMRKQKEEHQAKLREQNQEQSIHRRLYSDTALQHMREQLQQRIQAKREQIEERVKAIEERRAKRGKHGAQEAEYRKNMHVMREKARSSSKLPSIERPSLPRNGSLGVLSHQSKIEHEVSKKRLAQMKQENIVLKEFENAYSRRIEDIIRARLHIGSDETPLKNMEPTRSRHKIMGNEFLKDSLLMARKNSPSSSLPQLQTHQAHVNPNAQVDVLRDKWSRMLSKVKHGEISAEQGLQLLNNLEKRLDKIDLGGVKERLRQKYEVFSGETTKGSNSPPISPQKSSQIV